MGKSGGGMKASVWVTIWGREGRGGVMGEYCKREGKKVMGGTR